MSELINNSEGRKAVLKKMILKLHGGADPDAVKKELVDHLRKVPYNEVVEVSQDLTEKRTLEGERRLLSHEKR